MADINPYAAPQQDGRAEGPLAEPRVLVARQENCIWQDGDLLVMRKDAVLPDRCVKCNRPADGRRLKCRLWWIHPQYAFFVVLIALLSFAFSWLLMLIARHRTKVEIGLCRIHHQKRQNSIFMSWMLILAGITMTILSVILEHYQGPAHSLFLMCRIMALAGVVGGMIYYGSAASQVQAENIDKEYVWVKKVDPAYLAEFPEVPW